MFVNEAECAAAGLDPKVVRSIARRLSKAAKEAQKLGITIFGGSGTGSLRFSDDPRKSALEIAYLDGTFDGGDGAEHDWGDGLIRGE